MKNKTSIYNQHMLSTHMINMSGFAICWKENKTSDWNLNHSNDLKAQNSKGMFFF